MQTNKKKIISIVAIVAILVIGIAIFVVAVVMDKKENESKKQALVQNEQTGNENIENKDINSQQGQGNLFLRRGAVASIRPTVTRTLVVGLYFICNVTRDSLNLSV